MSVSQLAYLGIGVSDMPAWKSFATEILGMQVTERADDGSVEPKGRLSGARSDLA